MYHPNELIQDIQTRLDRMVREFQTLAAKNKKLETENKQLAQSLEEAIKQQETLSHKLDNIRQETLKGNKALDQWKSDTRKEIRGIMKDVEKCIPQVETLLEKK